MSWNSQIKEVRYRSSLDYTLQPAMFYAPEKPGGKTPLLVALHTWSFDHSQDESAYGEWCIAKQWTMIHPAFRGPNWTPEGCGSEKAVADIVDAVHYARSVADIDPERIYLMGGSGGGYASLLLAGRYPGLWTAVSAWCPITDLTAWYHQCRWTGKEYWAHLAAACGGRPGESRTVDAEYRRRSALSWLSGAAGLPLDINTGIHDGHTGSVPVSHAIDAYNLLAAASDRIGPEAIVHLCSQETIPPDLAFDGNDPLYGNRPVLLRRISGTVRLTLFDGGHDLIHEAGLDWLERQRRSQTIDWSLRQHASMTFDEASRATGK